jgi:cytochrome c oxidase subunit 3
MWIGLSAILMLFAAFTSAMVVRKGASNDWDQAQLPAILYWNTAFLIASSITLELARAALRTLARSQSLIESARARGRYRGCLYATLMLGVCFIAGQLLAWNQLTAAGIFLETNPSSSFFYLLTAAHGVHLLGGIVALLYLVFHVRKTLSETPGLLRTAVDVASIYWHFMDGLWVYLLVILTVRW